MKLRIRGNSLRLRVSKTELAKIAETGKAEDTVRFLVGAEPALRNRGAPDGRRDGDVRGVRDPRDAAQGTFGPVAAPRRGLRRRQPAHRGRQGAADPARERRSAPCPATAAGTTPLRRYNLRCHERSLRVASRVERCYNIAELRKLAKKNMPAPMFHYIDGAADDEWTLAPQHGRVRRVRVPAAHARRRLERSTCRRRCSVRRSTGRFSARRPRCSACSITKARAALRGRRTRAARSSRCRASRRRTSRTPPSCRRARRCSRSTCSRTGA